jgi:hypothetical protein
MKTCIICLEKDNLYSYPCYYNKCKCKYNVHNNCIYKWNLENDYCLICKEKYNYKFINIKNILIFLILYIYIYIYIKYHPFNKIYNI